MKSYSIVLAFGVSMMAMSELRAADDEVFHFTGRGRRDPFTAPVSPAPVEEIPKRIEFKVTASVEAAQELYGNAELAALEQRYSESLEKCDSALTLLENVDAAHMYSQDLRQRILQLRKVDERMRQREDVESAYGKLHLSITGVLARERSAQAVINGVIVREGHTLSAGEDTLLVEAISPRKVVVNFRGYRMLAPVSGMSK